MKTFAVAMPNKQKTEGTKVSQYLIFLKRTNKIDFHIIHIVEKIQENYCNFQL